MIKNTFTSSKQFFYQQQRTKSTIQLKSFLLILSFLFCTFYSFAQKNDYSSAIIKTDSILNEAVSPNYPGYALMIIKDGDLILSKGYGLAEVETERKLDSQSAFYLASLSKQFTGMAYGILYEKGQIDFEDYITKYLPDFPSYGNEIKIKHLLTHTSGLPDYYTFIGENINKFTNNDVWNILLQRDSLMFEPGEKYSYSNSAYVLLSLIVEEISGKTFAEFLKDNIFIPLKMNNTFVHDESKPIVKNKAIGYSPDSLGRFFINDYNLSTTGAGGIYSTLGDLFKWDQALYTETLVKKSTLQKILTPFILNNGTSSDYGFGWAIKEFKDGVYKGKKYYSHTGSLKGFRNIIIRFPEINLTLICLSNSGKALSDVYKIFELFF